MHRSWLRTLFALAVGSLLFVASSMAANRVEVRVLQDGNPVEGAAVDVIVSSGVVSGVTDAKGVFVTDISGNYFRLKVEGKVEVAGYPTTDSPVTVVLD